MLRRIQVEGLKRPQYDQGRLLAVGRAWPREMNVLDWRPRDGDRRALQSETSTMLLAANILAALVLAIHIYIVLLETVLFRSRGVKVFGLNAERAEIMAPAMSNQGCYNGFLAAALALGFLWPEPTIAKAFMIYGLACVAVAGIWGAATVMTRILYIQTVPAVLALAAFWLAM